MKITILLYQGFSAIDASGPADVFHVSNQLSRKAHYQLEYISPEPSVTASNGMTLSTSTIDSKPPEEVSMLLVPGADEGPLRSLLGNEAVLEWVRRASVGAKRLCSVCSGAFILASVGLLDGRRATTHWRGLESLGYRFPQVHLQHDVLYVEDGNVWTSAGVTSGVDMALAIVERDHGRPLALAVAREMVLFLVRPGGQSQYSTPLALQRRSANTDLRSLPFWLEERLAEGPSVAEMAAAVSMSERNFHRRCKSTFGLTPNALLNQVRIDRARLLLEGGALTLNEIAEQTGFNDSSAFGKVFRQRCGVTPGEYRSRFGPATPG